MGVQNFEGFFTDFGSPVPPVSDEKPGEILNRQLGSAELEGCMKGPPVERIRYYPENGRTETRMNENRSERLADVAARLGQRMLAAAGQEYPLRAMLWDMRRALEALDPETIEGSAGQREAGAVQEGAEGFLRESERFLAVIEQRESGDLAGSDAPASDADMLAMLEALREGPRLVDRLAETLIRHDGESPLLPDILPLGKFAGAFRAEIERGLAQVREIQAQGEG